MIRWLFLVLLGASSLLWAETAPLKVLSSIGPLNLLVRDIGGASLNAETLLPISASPHDYALRFSDLKAIRRADLLVWVSPDFEAFLAKPYSRLGEMQTQLSLATLDGLSWPHVHPGHGPDLHLWLSSHNIQVIVAALEKTLAQLRPEAAPQFRQNAVAFLLELEMARKAMERDLRPLQQRPFAVYHDGYQHFVDEFKLQQVAYVTEVPEQQIGAKYLAELSELTQGANCLLVERGEEALARKLAAKLQLRVQIVDLLPNTDESARFGFVRYWQGLGKQIEACLTK